MSLSTASYRNPDSGSTHVRSALPVPIIRGARIIRVANSSELPALVASDGAVRPDGPASRLTDLCQLDEACERRAAFHCKRSRHETSHRASCALRPQEPALEATNPVLERSPAARLTESLQPILLPPPEGVIPEELRLCTASRRYPNPHLLEVPALQESVVVERAVLEDGDHFGEMSFGLHAPCSSLLKAASRHGENASEPDGVAEQTKVFALSRNQSMSRNR